MEGQAVPKVTVALRTKAGEWAQKTTDDLFKNKTVVFFALPGAFTPTCSSTHLPGYNKLAPAFKKLGVDDIICSAVNDTFVMNQWAEEQKAENVTFLPDGNGDFAKGMGLLRDFSKVGFGQRSWRYSMLVKNEIVEKMFIEPVKEGDPFEVSDAMTMLKYINPDAKPQPTATIFTMPGCPHCARAKKMLTDEGIQYEEISVAGGEGNVSFNTVFAVTGRDTVPQVFMDGKHLGGADDLAAALKK